VNDFSVPLYVSPSKESFVLRHFAYGTIIDCNSEFFRDRDRNWLPVEDSEFLSGYVMRSQIREYFREKRFQVVSEDVESKLNQLKKAPNSIHFQELIDFLSRIEREGRFQGEEYIFFRLKAGEALGLFVAHLPEDALESEFLKRYQIYLVKDPKLRLDEEYFWSIASENHSLSEKAASLAVQYSPRPVCRKDPFCILDWLNRTYLRYLMLFPYGNSSEKFAEIFVRELESALSVKEQIQCFPPFLQENQRTYERTSFRIQLLRKDYRRKAEKLLQNLREECLPSQKR